MEIKGEKPVLWGTVREVLEEKEKEKELGYEQKNAAEHLKKFSKIQQKKAGEMIEELSTIPKLKERHIINIINFLPQDKDDLTVLFSGENVDLTDEEKKKILDTVKAAI